MKTTFKQILLILGLSSVSMATFGCAKGAKNTSKPKSPVEKIDIKAQDVEGGSGSFVFENGSKEHPYRALTLLHPHYMFNSPAKQDSSPLKIDALILARQLEDQWVGLCVAHGYRYGEILEALAVTDDQWLAVFDPLRGVLLGFRKPQVNDRAINTVRCL